MAVLALAIISPSACGLEVMEVGCIDASLDDGGATLDGSTSTPGGGSGSSGSGDQPSAPPPIPCETLADGSCARDTFTVTSPVTLADIASFHPRPAIDSMEPSGWGVVGLPTNFFGSSEAEIHTGTLLDRPASVRFTPVAWSWNYGDGTAVVLGTPGATWSRLGVNEFDETATSHTFRAAGNYTITLTIGYSAEYRVGALGWTPIAGILPVEANVLTVSVGGARTVLVDQDCEADRAGPGC